MLLFKKNKGFQYGTEYQKNFEQLPAVDNLPGFGICTNIYSTTEHVPREHELLYVLDGKITLHWEDHLVPQAMPGDFLLVESGIRHGMNLHCSKGCAYCCRFQLGCAEFFQFVNNRTLPDHELRCNTLKITAELDFLRSNWDDSPEYKQHVSLQLHSILLLFYFDLMKSRHSTASNAMLRYGKPCSGQSIFWIRTMLNL